MVHQVLAIRDFDGYSLDDVKRVVENNDKQRFGLVYDEGMQEYKIRAHQGHTMDVSTLKFTVFALVSHVLQFSPPFPID